MQTEETIRPELTPADYLAILRRHWVMIAILALIGPVVGYAVSRVVPARFISQTLVLVQPPSVPNSIVPQLDATSMNQKLASLKQQILSRSNLEPIIHKFGLFSRDVNKHSMDELVARLQEGIDVTPVAPMADTGNKDLPGFSISVTLDDPHKAQDVCTELTSLFIAASNGSSVEQSNRVTDFLTGQLAEAKGKLDDQDGKLAAFKSRNFGSLPDNEQANLNLLTGLTTQLDAADEAISRAQQDKTYASSMLGQQLSALEAAGAPAGQDPDTLKAQLQTLQAQLAALEATYTPDYPDVVKTKGDIANLERRIASNKEDATKAPIVEPPQITALRAQVHEAEQVIAAKTKEQEQIRQQIELYRARVQQSPVVEEQYKELTRGYQTALDSYNALLKERNDAEMAGDLNRQQQGAYFHVLDAANLPSKPAFPDRRMFTAGGLLGGLALGIGMGVLLELKDTSLKSEHDVEFTLRLPVLAMIPDVEPSSTKKAKTPALVGAGSDTIIGLRA
jgi:polysaccharide chain length determinant protein (PEP-CTERM system associated)